MNFLPKAKLENIVVQNFSDETMIYDLIANQAYCLNATSAAIWQACDGKTSFEDVRKTVDTAYSDEIIHLTLNELKKNDLLLGDTNVSTDLLKYSRRQMIAKYGTMAVSLPIITAIVAPRAINAASCGNTTNDPSNCGFCGNVCSVTNGTASCASSTCTIASCNPGFRDCDGLFAGGCETNITNDNQNCGGCGFSCSGPTPNCVNSSCTA